MNLQFTEKNVKQANFENFSSSSSGCKEKEKARRKFIAQITNPKSIQKQSV